MTATMQLMKTRPISQVENIELENPTISITAACELMKKLTVTAISSMCYLRGIFPERAFGTRHIDDMPVRVLHGLNDIPGTYTLISWIKSAFTAVKDNYLKKILLVIEKPEDENTLEVYTFKFSYDHELIKCSLQSDLRDKVIELSSKNMCPGEVKTKAKQMLRSLLTYTSTLEPLPPGCELGMRLEFYDDVPANYVLPQNFKAVESLGIKFPESMPDLVMGKVDCKFTTFTVVAKSLLFGNEGNQEEDYLECEDEVVQPSQEPDNNSLPFPRTLSRTSYSQLVPQFPAIDQAIQGASTDQSSETRLSEALSAADLNQRTVKCICECVDDCNDNLKCASCFTFQHRACYKIQDDNTVNRHICIDCHETDNYSKTCTRLDLLDEKERKESALHRRALVFCLSKPRVSVNMISTHLNISRQVALNMFNRLGSEGCFQPPSGKGFSRAINIDHLNHSLSLYFCDDSVADMDAEENNMNKTNTNKNKRKLSLPENDQEKMKTPTSYQLKRKRLAAIKNVNIENISG